VNWESWLLWGFVSTLLLTMTLAGAQGLKLTRLNMPFMLGMMFTADRDKARLYGFLLQLLSGWGFSLLYVLIFQSWGVANWWRGLVIGVLHGLFVLVVVMSMLPGLHPRMASEQHGPAANRELEPPGFLALNYGITTPLSVILSHAVFGAVLGAFYKLALR
jgi:uncharacterized membrane protein YagU involved in acid resistance